MKGNCQCQEEKKCLREALREVLKYRRGEGIYDVRHESDAGLTLMELWERVELKILSALAMGKN